MPIDVRQMVDGALDETACSFHAPNFFEIADRLADLYVSYRQRYVMIVNGAIFVPKYKNGGPIPLSNSMICKHLNKQLAIGVFAGEYSSKFICFDVDDGSQDTVRTILSLSEEFGIPREYVHVSSSGGKGYHVEIFFDQLVYTKKLKIFYDLVILYGQLNPAKVEFRPTKSQAIKLPLSKHGSTGNTCWFVDRDTFEPLAYDDYICGIKKFSAATFNNLVDHCGIRISPFGTDSIGETRAPQRELTPQEQSILDGTCPYPEITEPGQRHDIARAIAIHNRISGMTFDESYSALVKWWDIQDKTITTTPDAEAIDDIRRLVEWTFSDTFVVLKKSKELTITRDMLRTVLSGKTKTERKFLFLLSCFNDVYGRLNMSYERIAKYLGCSTMCAKQTISRLVIDEGLVRSASGRTSHREGKYLRKPNTYWVNMDKSLEDLEIEWAFEEPLIYHAQETPVSDESGRMRSIIHELEPDGFTDFYYQIIRQTIAPKSIKEIFTRGEIEALAA